MNSKGFSCFISFSVLSALFLQFPVIFSSYEASSAYPRGILGTRFSQGMENDKKYLARGDLGSGIDERSGFEGSAPLDPSALLLIVLFFIFPFQCLVLDFALPPSTLSCPIANF